MKIPDIKFVCNLPIVYMCKLCGNEHVRSPCNPCEKDCKEYPCIHCDIDEHCEYLSAEIEEFDEIDDLLKLLPKRKINLKELDEDYEKLLLEED